MRDNLKNINFNINDIHIGDIFRKYYLGDFEESIDYVYNCYQQIADYYKETNTFDIEQLANLCEYLDMEAFNENNNKFKFDLLSYEEKFGDKENFSYQISKALQMYLIYENKIKNTEDELERERYKLNLETIINSENFIDRKMLNEFEYAYLEEVSIEDIMASIERTEQHSFVGFDKVEKVYVDKLTFNDVVLTDYLTNEIIDLTNCCYDTKIDYKYVDLMKAIAIENNLFVDNVSFDFSDEKYSLGTGNSSKYTCSLFNPSLAKEGGLSEIKDGYAKIDLVIYPGLNSFDFMGLKVKDGELLKDGVMFLDEPLDEKLREYSINTDYGNSF